MKFFLTTAILMMALFANAQIVNIPDPNFKAALIYAGVDTDHDGNIQESEAAAVTTLNVAFNEANAITVQDLTGIRSFVNLQSLDAHNHSADSINISGMKFLRSASISAYPLSLTYVNATGCDSLQQLNVEGLRIGTLDVRGSKKLRSLSIYFIRDLLAAGCSELSFIRTGTLGGTGSSIEHSLDVTGCTNLREIYLQECGLESVDLSTCTSLTYFGIYAGTNILKYLNVKNGIQTTVSLTDPDYAGGDPAAGFVLGICADDFEVNSIRAGLTTWLLFYPQFLNVNPYCSFFPGGRYNTISGTTRFDANSNGCDNADDAIPNVPVKITDNTGNSLTRYSNAAGNYTHYAAKGNYTVMPYFPYPYFTITPASTNIVFDTANSLLDTANFCIRPGGLHNDLEIVFMPAGPARPGFDTYYTLVYKNRGTTTLSGTVTVNFDNSKMNFISGSVPVTTQSTGQLSWNYNNLEPFESRQIDIRYQLLPPPVNELDDTLNYLASITPALGDETPFDNHFLLPQRILGSYDPNDKQCIEGSKLDISKIGEYLHYQIRFQNEGTDTAFNIVVADTLSDKLDWNSFAFTGSSHACDPVLKNNRAEFYFSNIQLPYKAINEPASNGWVAFKIKPKPSVVVGNVLNNSAAIYFDFNMPIITNTASTVVTSSSTPVPVKLEYFSGNQKNNTNVLNWKASCTYGNASFIIERSDDGIHFKGIGNINAAVVRCQLPFNFTDNNPATGKNYYRLKITDADGISFYSKTLVVGNNKAGIEIKAIANNIIYLNSNKQQTVKMKIIAADGKEIWSEIKAITAGSNSIVLQVKKEAKGMYTLIAYTNEGETITKRFVQ